MSISSTRSSLIKKLSRAGVHMPVLRQASDSWLKRRWAEIQCRGRVSFNPREPRLPDRHLAR